MKESLSARLFNIFNAIFLVIISLLMFIPFINIIAISLSGKQAIMQGRVTLYPIDFNLDAYSSVIGNVGVRNSFLVTVFITVVGTVIDMAMTVLLAYPLSKREFMPQRLCVKLILFTFVFSVPLIPMFLWVKTLGMYDTLWALIIPGSISTFNFFILRSFFVDFPSEVIESARIDGAGEMRTLFQLVLPLSKPVLATLTLFYAVSHWNSYFSAIVYIRNPKLVPLVVKLRNFLIEDDANRMSEFVVNIPPESIKMAVIMVATIPILLVYPFLQKYFVKGMQLGSLKG